MALILDGKAVSMQIGEKLARKVSSFLRKPILAIISIAADKRSLAYIKQKQKFGEKIGVSVQVFSFQISDSEDEVVETIQTLNKDANVAGIIVQIPIPPHFNKQKLIEAIDPAKDADGLTAHNTKLAWDNNEDGVTPATTKGILMLLDNYSIDLSGKKVLIIGRSSLVGKPTAIALLNRDATVTLAHSKTENLAKEIASADIVISAVGKPAFITADMVSPHTALVDVGISVYGGERLAEETDARDTKEKLVGDVDFENVAPIVKAISPVPGGVGPMTVAALFDTVVALYQRAGGN